MLGYDSLREVVENITDIGAQAYADPGDREALISDLLREGRILGREVRLKNRNGNRSGVLLNLRLGYDGDENRNISRAVV
jgi:hypothetical protein